METQALTGRLKRLESERDKITISVINAKAMSPDMVISNGKKMEIILWKIQELQFILKQLNNIVRNG